MNKLRSICPKFATLAGGEIVNRNDVKTGSRLTISPGFMIPIDDTVVEGETFVDESNMTGQHSLVSKSVDSMVLSGTINSGESAIDIFTTVTSHDSSISKLIKLVEIFG